MGIRPFWGQSFEVRSTAVEWHETTTGPGMPEEVREKEVEAARVNGDGVGDGDRNGDGDGNLTT